MAKFLNNTGLARLVALIKQALGGKADKTELPLVVTFTDVDDNISCDTSIADIYAAYSSGRHVVGHRNENEQWELTSSGPNSALFSALITSMQSMLVGNNDGSVDTWLSVITYYQEALTFDSAPTAGSGNPVTSGGVKTALDGKQATLVSGTNIKTVCGSSILGSGDLQLVADDIYTGYGSVEDALNAKQDTLVSGTNIKTVNNNSLLGSGNVDLGGGDILYLGKGKYVLENAVDSSIDNALDDLDNAIHELGTPNEIARITATESQTSGGNNTVTITETNGTTTTFNVKNGIDGADGVDLGEVALVQTTGDSEESVMSQKAVTEYGRKVTAEDLNGTSSLVVNQMTDAGVDINKRTLNGYVYTQNGYCLTKIPVEYGHAYTVYYKDVPSRTQCGYRFLNENGENVKSVWYNGTTDSLSIFADNTSYKELQVTFSMPNLKDSYIWDATSDIYVFRGDSFIASLCSGLLVDTTMLRNEIITQELGENETLAVSQKTITEKLKGNQGWTFTTNHYWGRGMDVSRSEYTYNLSEKPVIDVVSFNVYSGNGTPNGFFFFSPILANSYVLQGDSIGFTYSVWKIIFVVRRGGTTLLSQEVWSNNNSTSGSISGFRLDFRRKTIIIKKRECQTGIIDTVEIDLSGYDLDLGKSFLYTGFGGPNSSMGIYIGYNSYTYLDFDGYFHLPVRLGSPKPVEDYALVSNYYGNSFGGFSGFSNITATKVADNHYSIALDSSSYVLFGANYLPIKELGNGITMQNGNSEWVFKIKATGAEIMMKSGAYVTFRDAWNLTDNEEFVANNGEYTLADGKEYEIRLRYQVNANIRWFMQLKGTATVELYDCRIYGIMNTWIIPLNYDGYRIKGSIPFLYSYPEKALIIPTINYSNNSIESYVSGQLRVNTNNNIYMNVFDQSTMKFIEKQINNS